MFCLKINNNKIVNVNVNKLCFLGIMIDEKLTVQNHVKIVTNDHTR